LRYFVVLVSAFLLAGATATGQEVFRIEGVVTDTSGDVLPGAEVTADGPQTVH
jgi:hypothetical protein